MFKRVARDQTRRGVKGECADEKREYILESEKEDGGKWRGRGRGKADGKECREAEQEEFIGGIHCSFL